MRAMKRNFWIYSQKLRIDKNSNFGRLLRKSTKWFPKRSDTNTAVQAQKIAKTENFRFRK